MEDQNTAAGGRKMFATVVLEAPIQRAGSDDIVTLTLRRPGSGELRGLSMVRLGQMEVNELLKLLPRITMPVLTDLECAAIDPADMMEICSELGDFLLTKSRAAELPTT